MKTESNRARLALGWFLNLPALLCLSLASAILISCPTPRRVPVTHLAPPPPLHAPPLVCPKACPACVFGSLVIYQPAAGRVAAMVGGKQELIDAVKASGMVGTPLDMEM